MAFTSSANFWAATVADTVPGAKRSRSLVIACRKCRNMREYRLMEPEMSQRTTRLGQRVAGGFLAAAAAGAALLVLLPATH